MALTVEAVGQALTHVTAAAAPTPTASLSGLMVVAAVSESATMSSTLLSPDTYRNMNFTDMRTDHWSHKKTYDTTTPRNMMYGFTGILLLCVLLQLPRFLARLYASLGRKHMAQTESPLSAIPHSAIALTHSRQKVQRQVGGGGVFSGWFLGRGQLPTGLSSPTLESKEAFESSNPFSDDNIQSPGAGPLGSDTPSLLPPPHVIPVLNHLPLARWAHGAPFLNLPAPFGSMMHTPQLVVIALYLIVCITALLWKSDPLPPTAAKPYGNDFQRSGLVGMVQIPLVIALGVRGNIIGLCVGKGYERLKTFHKIVGRVCFLATGLHVAFWTAKWVWMGKFGEFSMKLFIVWAWVAWAGLVLIVFTSLPWVRKKWFALFEVCHTIGIIAFLVGTALHVRVAKPWCAAGAVIYFISMIFTLFKTKITKAELLALQTASSTVVTIPALRTGWRAGQHVRIRVPALGWRLGFEGHPFTISSAPDGEGLILMCKNSGDWTRALHKLAQGPVGHSESALGPNAPVDVTMIVEGPHGGMGNTMLPAFSSVLLCAGGSGITHSLALAHDLMTKATTGVVRARTIDLVWVIRTEEAARPLMPTLLDMVNDAKAYEMACLNDRRYGGSMPLPTALRVKIFVTRCPSSSPLMLASTCEAADDHRTQREHNQSPIDIAHISHEAMSDPKNPFNDQNPFIDPEVQVAYLNRKPSSGSTITMGHPEEARDIPLSSIAAYPKRAQFDAIVSTLVEETISRHRIDRTQSSGVCVTACGPEPMVESVNVAVRSVDAVRRRAVGGVDFEEECFGY